jgi:hypothetical protein
MPHERADHGGFAAAERALNTPAGAPIASAGAGSTPGIQQIRDPVWEERRPKDPAKVRVAERRLWRNSPISVCKSTIYSFGGPDLTFPAPADEGRLMVVNPGVPNVSALDTKTPPQMPGRAFGGGASNATIGVIHETEV